MTHTPTPHVLIADSGSTKTDWALLPAAPASGSSGAPSAPASGAPSGLLCGDTVAAPSSPFHTQGITPVHQSPATIRHILSTELLPQLPPSTVTAVHFYGAGCTSAHAPMMADLLCECFPAATVEVNSDLLGAARALCGRAPGVACILGTGANSCLYDGTDITQNTPALGYILGDEGSGAVLGRLFLNAVFKDPRLAEVRDDFLATHQLTMADIIQRVYREPMANRFLASTSLYIGQHLDNPLLRALVVGNFRQFFLRNIVPYQRPDLPVHFVGSMAHHYCSCLEEAAHAEGFTVGRVLKSPLSGLSAFHRQ